MVIAVTSSYDGGGVWRGCSWAASIVSSWFSTSLRSPSSWTWAGLGIRVFVGVEHDWLASPLPYFWRQTVTFKNRITCVDIHQVAFSLVKGKYKKNPLSHLTCYQETSIRQAEEWKNKDQNYPVPKLIQQQPVSLLCRWAWQWGAESLHLISINGDHVWNLGLIHRQSWWIQTPSATSIKKVIPFKHLVLISQT